MAPEKAKGAWRPVDGRLHLASREFPPVPCCYAIYFDSELVYVGQTANLRKRFANYRIRASYTTGYITPWGLFHDVGEISVKFKPSRRYGDWAMRELRLIRRLRPRLNCAGSIRKRCSVGLTLDWQKRAMEASRRLDA